MGREWLYWVSGGGRRRKAARLITKQEAESTSAGCMYAVLHLFDLNHHLPLNHQHSLAPAFLQQQHNININNKGVEAPRNSLEMEEPPSTKQEDLLINFPSGIEIKTRREDFSAQGGSSSSMDSPGIKTPNLVARLMGLDLLPETNSPSFSCPNSKLPTKSHLQINHAKLTSTFYDEDIQVGARSLPATPRISSARRSDAVDHHRLSLQINKENTHDEFSVSAKTARPRFRQQQQDENRSPGHYAKQILKQVKESVSRRVGHDITNTTRYTDDDIRRDQNLLLKLSKKNSTKQPTSSSSSSPKLRILHTNKNRAESPTNPTSSDSNVSKPPKHEEMIHKMGKKLSPKTCDQPITRNKREDAFVRSPAEKKKKKSKKAQLSTELIHLSGPAILPVKKDPSPPATKLPQKQAQVSDALSSKRNTQLSCNTSWSYKQLPLQSDKIFTAPQKGCVTISSGDSAAEQKCYVQKILKRAGIIDNLTPLTLGKWHTPSHPLDPSIFYYLELFHPAASPSAAALSCRCNRKLIFQLVDEILADILRPHLDFKPWVSPASVKSSGFALADNLCEKIESLPAVDCRVLEDIDFLIERDLRKSALNGYYEEEGERLVREIEGEMVERLVSEAVAVTVAEGIRTEGQKRWISRDEMP